MTASTRLIFLALIAFLAHSVAAMPGTLRAQEIKRLVSAQDTTSDESHMTTMPVNNNRCRPSHGSELENIQIETSDIALHEQLFESVLQVTLVQRLDHPQTDRIRAYCYRHVLIVIRQDLRTPRPTGWIQVNFIVSDVTALQEELEGTTRSAFAMLDAETRDKIVRFRFKPGVMRNQQKVDRLELYGSEGFLIGFNQPLQ